MSIETAFEVLITDRFDVEAEAQLRSTPGLFVKRSLAPVPTPQELKTAQGLIIRSRTLINKDLLTQASQLKVIVTATSGFDHIDCELAREKNIAVMFTPEANAASAAELTWALVLAAARRIPSAHRGVKAGEWRRDALIGIELSRLTYGVIGLGRIGTRVAKIAKAFGMRVVAFDPYKDDEHFNALQIDRLSQDELFKESDVVSCHVPATRETHHMILPLHLSEAGHPILFVNTSRGSVIAETVLTEALDEGWIGACGLDVFEREPLPRASGLQSRENVILTPHIGATTHQAFRAASLDAARKMINFALFGQTEDRLPPEEAWWAGGFMKSQAD